MSGCEKCWSDSFDPKDVNDDSCPMCRIKHLRAALTRLGTHHYGFSDDKSGVFYMAREANQALERDGTKMT